MINEICLASQPGTKRRGFSSVQREVIRVLKTTSSDVANLSFCSLDLPAEDTVGKKTLKEMQTYASLLPN